MFRARMIMCGDGRRGSSVLAAAMLAEPLPTRQSSRQCATAA